MPTPPRRWPLELESERTLSLDEAMAASQYLLDSQQKMDTARCKVASNPSLALLLLSEADRSSSDALARLERLQRNLIVCRGKPITGRWPSVAAGQRDDAWEAAQSATNLICSAQEDLARAMDKMQGNPSLAEVVIVDGARKQAKSLVLTERIARLMTEAAMGRD